MVMKQKLVVGCIVICATAMMVNLSGCRSSAPSATDQAAISATGTASPSPPLSANALPTAAPPNMGEPIDTSKHDAEIVKLEKQAQKSPGDETTRTALAQAYLARANALKDARQYRVALGDYRRALRYDPDNVEAQQMAAVIVSIMKEMNREVPVEGEEPVPLAITPDTSEDEEGAASPSTKKTPRTRNTQSGKQ